MPDAIGGGNGEVDGDMNVGATDLLKNGFRLAEDHYARADGDLYDDTHAIV